jgi:signal peptidase II
MNGAVVDFIDLRWWPVFNVADIGIVCGVIAVAFSMIVTHPEEIEGTQ